MDFRMSLIGWFSVPILDSEPLRVVGAEKRPSGVDHTTPLKCCTSCYSIISHATLNL